MATVSFTQLFAPVAVGSSATVLYTTPSNPTTTVILNGRVRFANTTGGPLTITAWAIPSGGAAGTGNMILNAESIGANAHLDSDFPQLAAGDVLQAQGSNTGITATCLSGVTYA